MSEHPKKWDAPGGRAGLVLLLSGFIGFWIGASGFATWQAAVETSQVIAGIVQYQAPTPFFIYHVKSWNLLHHVIALGLNAGFSEKTLSILLSGVGGMISFQALSLCVLALARDRMLALAAPFFVASIGVDLFGTVYPVNLFGTPHTYGMIALSYFLLTAALLGVGNFRSGAFLLGLAPAVHPTYAALLWAIFGAGLLWSKTGLRERLRAMCFWLVCGAGVAALSLAVHLVTASDGPTVDPQTAHRYFDAFIRDWDGHRVPVGFFAAGIALNAAGLALSLLWLLKFDRDLPKPALALLWFFAVSAAAGLGGAVISWMPPDQVPRIVMASIPARFLNINSAALGAVLIGLFGRYQKGYGFRFTLLICVGLLWMANHQDAGYPWTVIVAGREVMLQLLPRLLMVWPAFAAGLLVLHGLRGILLRFGAEKSLLARLQPWLTVALFAAIMIRVCDRVDQLMVLFGVLLVEMRRFPEMMPKAGHLSSWVFRAPRFAVLAVLGAIAFQLCAESSMSRAAAWAAMKDRTNDAFFREVAVRPGMLLTCSNLHYIQLRTRRPVLLDGYALDYLPYLPEVGPQMEEIIREVHGIDFFRPPENTKHKGGLTREAGKELWQTRSAADWVEIRKRFDVTDVLTFADWKLKLPEAARSGEYVLYAIPP